MRSSAAITDGVPPNIDPLGLQKALVRKHRKRFRSLHRSHRIRDYFSGRTTPSSSTLGLFDKVYPGTREVFEHGPDRSHLWDATFCRDPERAKSVSFDLKHNIQHGVLAERSVRRRRSSKLPRVERVLIPDSLARAFRVSESERLDVASTKLASSLLTNPRLADSLSTFVDGENALHVDGPLVQIIPDVTFSAKTRQKQNAFVRPSPLAGLALQILHAKINHQNTVVLNGWDISLIDWRLHNFGVVADQIEELSGLRFRASRPTKAEIAVLRRLREFTRNLAAATGCSTAPRG